MIFGAINCTQHFLEHFLFPKIIRIQKRNLKSPNGPAHAATLARGRKLLGRRAGNRRGRPGLAARPKPVAQQPKRGRRRTQSAATGAGAPTSWRRSGGRRRPTADLRLRVEIPSTHGSRARVASTTARSKGRRRERGRRRRSSSPAAGDGGACGKRGN
jgi:hypothetical protein